jgi:hypothetical protein
MRRLVFDSRRALRPRFVNQMAEKRSNFTRQWQLFPEELIMLCGLQHDVITLR